MSYIRTKLSSKVIFLLLVLIVLMALSGVYVIEGAQAYSRLQQTTLANQENCGGQKPVHICVHIPTALFSAFYPSYQAAQYPLFSVNYNSTQPITLIIRVTIVHFSQVQTRTVNALPNDQTVYFIPPLVENVLHGLTHEENTIFHVEADDTQNHLYYSNDIPLVLHSRWLMQWIAADRLKIAAWVTPDDPSITALIEKATSHLQTQLPPTPVGLTGYKDATQHEVIDQVDAIYDTLALDYHMHYVQASIPYDGSNDNSAALQNIKLPAEVLQQHSGMCVELTTLLASAVEKIGLNAEIVIIPGHAFLGVAVSEDSQQIEYWDAVGVNQHIAGDSANIQADSLYRQNLKQHTILDTITISDAREARVGPML